MDTLNCPSKLKGKKFSYVRHLSVQFLVIHETLFKDDFFLILSLSKGIDLFMSTPIKTTGTTEGVIA